MPGLRKWRFVGLLITSFIVGSWLLGPAAEAHDVYEQAFVWYFNGEERCVEAKSLANFDKGGGPTPWFTEVTGSLYLHLLQVPCDAKLNKWSVAPGNLRVRTILWTRNPPGNSAWVCARMSAKYNSVTDWRLRQYRYWAYVTLRSCARFPAFHDWATNGGAWGKYNARWGGGYVWSGWHAGASPPP